MIRGRGNDKEVVVPHPVGCDDKLKFTWENAKAQLLPNYVKG
jgi:hypothetical protein